MAYEYEAGRQPPTEEHLEELRQAIALGWSRTH